MNSLFRQNTTGQVIRYYLIQDSEQESFFFQPVTGTTNFLLRTLAVVTIPIYYGVVFIRFALTGLATLVFAYADWGYHDDDTYKKTLYDALKNIMAALVSLIACGLSPIIELTDLLGTIIITVAGWIKNQPLPDLRGATSRFVDELFPEISEKVTADTPRFGAQYPTPLGFFYKSSTLVTAPVSLTIDSAMALTITAGYLLLMLTGAMTLDSNSLKEDTNQAIAWFQLGLVSAIAAVVSPIVELADLGASAL